MIASFLGCVASVVMFCGHSVYEEVEDCKARERAKILNRQTYVDMKGVTRHVSDGCMCIMKWNEKTRYPGYYNCEKGFFYPSPELTKEEKLRKINKEKNNPDNRKRTIEAINKIGTIEYKYHEGLKTNLAIMYPEKEKDRLDKWRLECLERIKKEYSNNMKYYVKDMDIDKYWERKGL